MLKFLFLGVLPMLTPAVEHKFYVSNTTVEHKANSGTFEITVKVFTDDLEAALSGSAGHAISLTNGSSNSEQRDLIAEYLLRNFEIKTDGIRLIQNYLGKETEFDLTYLFVECTASSPHAIAEVTNRMLTEIYPEQINIIHFHYGGVRQTQALDKKTQTAYFRP